MDYVTFGYLHFFSFISTQFGQQKQGIYNIPNILSNGYFQSNKIRFEKSTQCFHETVGTEIKFQWVEEWMGDN